VKEKIIVERLTKATGANYDSGAKIQGSSKLVPQSVAQGRTQSTQSNAKVRTFEKTQGTDQSTESSPAASSITYESRQLDQSTESKPVPSAIRYEARGQDQSTESKPLQSTLPGTRNPSSAPAVKGSTSSFKERFEQAAQGNAGKAPPPRSNAPPGRPAPSQPPPKQAEPPKQPEPEPEPRETYEEPAPQESYEEPYVEEPYVEEAYPAEEPYVEEAYPAEEPYAAEEPYQEPEPAAAPSGGAYAKALYDYDAENPDDLSFKEGDTIVVLDQSDPSGWWEGEINGKTGFFPSNFVELA